MLQCLSVDHVAKSGYSIANENCEIRISHGDVQCDGLSIITDIASTSAAYMEVPKLVHYLHTPHEIM